MEGETAQSLWPFEGAVDSTSVPFKRSDAAGGDIPLEVQESQSLSCLPPLGLALETGTGPDYDRKV